VRRRNLIIGTDTYTWIKNCAGRIIDLENEDFLVMLVCADDKRPLYFSHKYLCKEAIYAQRSHDIKCVGRVLGIKKVFNLLYAKIDEDIERLIAQIQLTLLFNSINTVFSQNDYILNSIIKPIADKLKIECFIYNVVDVDHQIKLTNKAMDTKYDLSKYMIGIASRDDLCARNRYETYKTI
jgi:hypothetical protein